MNRIKQLREERGWNQDYLGELLDVKRAAISKYETEKISLTADTIIGLAKIFNVPTDYLLGITNDPQLQSDTHCGQANMPTPEAELPAVIMQYGKSGQSFVYKKHESENFQELMQLIESFPEDKIKAILEIVKMMK